jgi:tRNA pseudouridine55 synthase
MGETAQPRAQALCGFLNVLKPPGMSSAAVVGRVRRLLGGEKVGHAGTLDPEAAGVLPLMVGKAARLFDYLQDKQKGYIAEVAFGTATDTQDAQGTAIAAATAYPHEAAVRVALCAFVGESTQVPPMYSALKRDGVRLYDMARQGREIALEARPVTVHALTLLGMTERHGALLHVVCAKGFYVRTLCHDLGQALGCPAHMRFLLRTQSGAFTLDTAHTLEELAQAAEAGSLNGQLLPVDAPLMHLPSAEVPARLEAPFLNGVPLRTEAAQALAALPEGQPARLYLRGTLIAIGVRQGETLHRRTWLGE